VLVYRLNQDLVSSGFNTIHKAFPYHVLAVIYPQILNLRVCIHVVLEPDSLHGEGEGSGNVPTLELSAGRNADPTN